MKCYKCGNELAFNGRCDYCGYKEEFALSFCIPTYNRIKALKKCIKSIIKHELLISTELVIVDGGSTDGTVKWITQDLPFKLNNIGLTVVLQKELIGITKSSNVAFKAAYGKYLAILNDDCTIIPSVYEEIIYLMEHYNNLAVAAPVEYYPPTNDKAYCINANVPGLILHDFPVFRHRQLAEVGYWNEETSFVVEPIIPILLNGYTFAFHNKIGVIHNKIHDENEKRSHANIERDNKILWDRYGKLRKVIRECIGDLKIDYSNRIKQAFNHRHNTLMELKLIQLFYDKDFPFNDIMHLAQKFPECVIKEMNK